MGLDAERRGPRPPVWLVSCAACRKPDLGWVRGAWFFIVFLVFRENSYTSATIEVAGEQKVIYSGPYAVVRHPMYAGAFLLVLFTPTALRSWVALPLPIPLILVIIARLLDEERFLSANLSGYEAYRIVPGVW